MKNNRLISLMTAVLVAASCDLDLSPLDKPATGNWYQDKEQVIMSLNNVQLVQFWLTDRTEAGLTADLDEFTDDACNRNSQNSFKLGTTTGNSSVNVKNIWSYTYKGISRCNAILDNMHKAKDTMSEEDYKTLQGCARFYRACFYSRICMLYGDPVMFLEDIIKMNIGMMFPGYEVDSSYCCKISRDADIMVDDEATSAEVMVEQLKKKVK